MPEPPNVAPVRGMRDLLPAECELRDWAVGRILDTYRRFGFARIETPALEHLALLTGGQGGENEKLIYKVLKRGEKLDLAAAKSEDDLADEGLRFDLTVPLARYYAANQGTLPQPFKAIQIGPVWRAERPQKGRFRQFTQCDIDVLGEAGEMAEVELILATTEALATLGLSDFTVRINDRQLLAYTMSYLGFELLSHPQVLITIDKLDKIGMQGVSDELAAQGHTARSRQGVMDLAQFVPAASAQTAGADLASVSAWSEWFIDRAKQMDPAAPAQRIESHTQEISKLRSMLTICASLLGDRGRVVFDPTLVRGMGYYTGSIFEISMEGAPGSIAGGGRYDKMIGRMLGREVPACGFSIGFERVIGLLTESGAQVPKAGTRFALLYEPGTDSLQRVMAEAAARRGAVEGNSVAVFAKRKKLGKQLDELEKAGFDCVLTLPAGNGPPEEKWLGGGAER